VKFLEEWDLAIEAARLHNKPGKVWNIDEIDPANGWPITRCVARTMHPAFMGGVPPKHDPERDK
jgi:hypothetical protein